jgi:hypothetical protein
MVLLVIGAIAAGVHYNQGPVQEITRQIQATLLPGTPTPTPIPAPDYRALIGDFRRGQQAALKNALEPTIGDVLGAVAVYATGEALQQVQDEVAALQTDRSWQELTLERLDNIQVLPDSPTSAKLLTEETYRRRTFTERAGASAPVADEHFKVSGVYVLENLSGNWMITDIALANNRVDLP